uniref:Uncharacterized protein n=1 Tax=viral metagenome TaxID=1070528 RepID=A0A6C0D1Z9_9ZZZZ
MTEITSFADFNKIYCNKYTVLQLKTIGVKFNVKWKNKKKSDIQQECYSFLKNGYYAAKIQKIWRNYLIRLFNHTQGPAIFKRSICNNVEDFLTTETMKEIDYYFFVSYKDVDGFIYGFNIISLFNLIKKKDIKNPYTRNIFSPELILMVEKRIHYNKLLKKTYHEINDTSNTRKLTMSVDDKINELFQKIDSFGNYTQSEWLTSLNTFYLRKFLLELFDIWSYRAQLLNETKILICPPFGTPFRDIPMHIISSGIYIDTLMIKKYCYTIVNKLINSAETTENQNLGAIYVLTALTLVNSEAANALPWLFQSVI